MTGTLLLLYLCCYFKILNHPNRIGLTRAVEFCAIMCRVIRTAWKSYISSRMCHFFSDILFFHIFFFSFLNLPKAQTLCCPLPHPLPFHFCRKTFIWEIVHLQDWEGEGEMTCSFNSFPFLWNMWCWSLFFLNSFSFFANIRTIFLVPLCLSCDFFFTFRSHFRNHKSFSIPYLFPSFYMTQDPRLWFFGWVSWASTLPIDQYLMAIVIIGVTWTYFLFVFSGTT